MLPVTYALLLVVAFLGRRQIAGLIPGSRILVDGTVTERRGQLVMINPDYEFLPSGEPTR